MNRHEMPKGYENPENWVAYLAAIFAADCEPTMVHKLDTSVHAAVAVAVATEAERQRLATPPTVDFYPVAFVESAAAHFNAFDVENYMNAELLIQALVHAGERANLALKG